MFDDALGITSGFWLDVPPPFGSVQRKDPPGGVAVAVKVSCVPVQTGELLVAVTVGIGFTVTVVVSVSVHPFDPVISTE